jgi:hypothetical protein
MVSERRTVVVIAGFTSLALAVGVVPWLLLAIDETGETVACLKAVRYNLWGWLLVVFLCGCAVNELRKWKSPWKLGKILLSIVMTCELLWALVWLLLLVLGHIISTIT